MARPERLELPTFWFVGGFSHTRQHTPSYRNQENQQNTRRVLGWRRLTLYPVHGQSHGQFRPNHAPEPFGQFRILVKVPMGVAAENSLPASVAFCPLPPNASPVRQALVLGFSFTAFHTTIVRGRGPCVIATNNHADFAELCDAVKRDLPQFPASQRDVSSDCLPDVPQQLFQFVGVAGECPRTVRVSRGSVHAS